MELKTYWGEVIFAPEGAKTVLEVVKAAIEAKKSLRDADLRDAVLRGADLRDAVLRDADLSGWLEGVPFIAQIHQSVYDAASKEDALDMGSWHSCDTTHCRAGWVVTLAGAAGKALEWSMGTPAAASVIYLKSDPTLERVPDFYTDNETALADMKRLAEEEAARV